MKLAINRTVVGKPTTADQNKKMTFTYENVDVSLEEFAAFVDAGYAFCAQHKDKHRMSANFICSDFVAVDIDSGLRLDEALANPFIKQYASLIYTTESHTEEAHRFRIVFQTDETITSAKEMKHAYTGATIKVGGDESCKDACRQFYGSSRPNTQILGKSLPKRALDELITLGSESTRRMETAGDKSGARASIVSEVALDLDTAVTVSDGSAHRLADLPERTSIFCPKHVDNKPSAFTLRSRHGVVGIHCSACKRTYFTSSDMPLFDFNYGLTNLDELKGEEFDVIETDGFVEYQYKSVFRLNEQYLSELPYKSPVTFVRSPKGTGKTKWLENIVARCQKEEVPNEGWRPGQKKLRKKSVLLIGHRQTLIQSVAQRLGLKPYFSIWEHERNGKTIEEKQNNSPTPYYAVCADSLSKLLNPGIHKYDVVLIDEVEQVISHLTSNTLRDRRIETFLFLKHYIDHAKEVYVLDADLNQLTVETLYALTSDKKKQVTFITNDYRMENRELNLYQNKLHLINDISRSIDQRQRCFVCANSKKKVESLAEALKDQFGNTKRILSITSGNSQDSAIQDFLNKIQTAILEYDVLIVSPALGTGVDITFPNSASEIDAVYGIFEARVNTHFDIDQQLSRVRNPGEVNVWISPEKFRFSIDPKVIKEEIRNTEKSTRQLIKIEDDGTLVYNEHDDYLDLYANVKAMQRGSKNDLRYHFRKLKEHYGWKIVDVEAEPESMIEGSELLVLGNTLRDAKVRERIENAKLITKLEYIRLDQLKKTHKLGSDHHYAMRRYEIESFYYQEVTDELIEKDRDGKYRREIRMYETFTADNMELIVRDQTEINSETHATDRKVLMEKKRLLHELFAVAGLSDNEHHILTEKIIEGDSLDQFARFCRHHHEKIAHLFGTDLRKDIAKKPAQQLSQFLRMIGIRWKKEKPVKRDGQKIYRYKVAQETIDELNEIVTKRANSTETEQWHKVREATQKNRLFEDEDGQNIRYQVEEQLTA